MYQEVLNVFQNAKERKETEQKRDKARQMMEEEKAAKKSGKKTMESGADSIKKSYLFRFWPNTTLK